MQPLCRELMNKLLELELALILLTRRRHRILPPIGPPLYPDTWLDNLHHTCGFPKQYTDQFRAAPDEFKMRHIYCRTLSDATILFQNHTHWKHIKSNDVPEGVVFYVTSRRALYARYLYDVDGRKSPNKKTFKRVEFCFETRWYRFSEECTKKPQDSDGRLLLPSEWPELWPRVPLCHLTCGTRDKLFTRINLNGIGLQPAQVTAFFFVAFDRYKIIKK